MRSRRMNIAGIWAQKIEASHILKIQQKKKEISSDGKRKNILSRCTCKWWAYSYSIAEDVNELCDNTLI